MNTPNDIIRILSDPRVLLLDEALQGRLTDPTLVDACKDEDFFEALLAHGRVPVPSSEIVISARSFVGFFESTKRTSTTEAAVFSAQLMHIGESSESAHKRQRNGSV